MKSSWSSFFPCANCGSQNVTGAGYCGNCGLNLYYNCPDCQGWVDVTFSNCPNCRVKLDWASGNTFRDKPSSPALMLLMLGIVMLITGSVYLIVNNSGSAAASTTASNPWPSLSALQSFISYQNNSAAISNTNTADYPGYDSTSAATRDNASYDVVLTIPAATPPVTNSSVNSPPGRSYLDTVYPTWGHCSGGRCRSITQ